VEVSLEAKESRMTVRAGKSRFNLQTLAAADFPRMVEAKDASRTLTLPQKALKDALRLVQFAMAVQDIRYYLNGVLFSVDKERCAWWPPMATGSRTRARPWVPITAMSRRSCRGRPSSS
jgi:DNA polymerase III sliding clamp (beta) subunit (PCNA family)